MKRRFNRSNKLNNIINKNGEVFSFMVGVAISGLILIYNNVLFDENIPIDYDKINSKNIIKNDTIIKNDIKLTELPKKIIKTKKKESDTIIDIKNDIELPKDSLSFSDTL